MDRFPIYLALQKPTFVLGAEKKPVLLLGTFAITMVIGSSAVSAIAALALWFGGLWALRKMAKADPLMSQVFIKHVNQQKFYPAKSSIWRRNNA